MEISPHPSRRAVVHMDESYTHDLIVRSLCSRNWSVTDPFANIRFADITNIRISGSPHISLQWLEYELVDWFHLAENPTTTLASSYCIRKGLIRKAQLAFNVKKYLSKRPNSVLGAAVPETWLFEIDHIDYLDEALSEVFEVVADLEANEKVEGVAERKAFIIKPSLANKAAGIHVFDTLEGLKGLFEKMHDAEEDDAEEDDAEEDEDNEKGQEESEEVEKDSDDAEEESRLIAKDIDEYPDSDSEDGDISQIREWVIQRYISRPLLLDDRKFHIRAYVLAVSNIRVYLYRDMLALFALKAYDGADLHDKLAHLTNTCLQIDSVGFEEEKSVRLFWDLAEDKEAGVTKAELEQIFEQMQRILADTFDACAGEMTTFQAIPNAFELFGFDFLIDEDKKVYLLEANSYPDFKQTGAQLKHVIENLFDETVRIAVEPFFTQGEKDVQLDRFVKVFERELLVN